MSRSPATVIPLRENVKVQATGRHPRTTSARWCAQAVAIVLLGACTPSASLTSVSPSASASASSSPTSPIPSAISARIPLEGLVALEPASDGVWYLRVEGDEGRLGRATVAGIAQEAAAGPAPVAIAAEGNSLFVLEGRPELSPERPRTDVLERIDPRTLTVIASAAVGGLATDVATANGMVWVIRVDGVLLGFRSSDLSRTAQVSLIGRGPGRVATGFGRVWALNGQVDESGATHLFVHRIDPTALARPQMVEIKGGGSFGVLAIGRQVWAGSGSSAGGIGRLYPLTIEGVRTEPLTISTPNALAAADGWIWWASADGHVGAINEETLDRTPDLSIGTGATDVAISHGDVWVAGDDLAVLGRTP